jgi:uncharacterized protein (TIGR00730 family)
MEGKAGVVNRICVFCGSTAGEDGRYLEAADRFGQILAREGIALVYGGSRVGMMGRIAAATLQAGGRVTGVIPGALMAREVAHQELTELRVVRSMHERKSEMAELSDAFVALPGGLGTLEGFFELLTWSQLGLHQKPCGILDVAGYFQPLVRFLDHMTREGFLAQPHRDMVVVEEDPDALVRRLREYQAPTVPRWIEAGQT